MGHNDNSDNGAIMAVLSTFTFLLKNIYFVNDCLFNQPVTNKKKSYFAWCSSIKSFIRYKDVQLKLFVKPYICLYNTILCVWSSSFGRRRRPCMVRPGRGIWGWNACPSCAGSGCSSWCSSSQQKRLNAHKNRFKTLAVDFTDVCQFIFSSQYIYVLLH